MIRARVVDLDGTISDDRWRRWLIDAGESEVDEVYHHYHLQLERDEFVNPWVVQGSQCPIVLVTARPAYVREMTERWLKKNGVPFHSLLMRPEGDHSPSPELKLKLIGSAGLEVECAFDDRADVIAAYASQCYPTVHLPEMEHAS